MYKSEWFVCMKLTFPFGVWDERYNGGKNECIGQAVPGLDFTTEIDSLESISSLKLRTIKNSENKNILK